LKNLKGLLDKIKNINHKKWWNVGLLLVLVVIAAGFLFYRFRGYPLADIRQKEQLYNSILADIKKPTFPDRVCKVSDYGAIADGQTKNTEAIAKAIADCSGKGGGTVEFPKGQWFTGQIHPKDNINLHLDDGAQIIFSTDQNDYLPAVFSRFQGMEYYNYSSPIYANGVTNVAITGTGQLIGNGDAWRAWGNAIPSMHARKDLINMVISGVPAEQRIFGENDRLRPAFIEFINCKNILVQDVSIEQGPMWTIHPVYSQNVTIDHVNVNTSQPNSDGVDVDSDRDVLIQNSTFSTGDDAISIKSGLEKTGPGANHPTQNVVIQNCTVKKAHAGVSIGSEITAGVSNVVIKNNTFSSCSDGFSIKSSRGRAGTIENIWLADTKMSGVTDGISLDTAYTSAVRIDNGSDSVFRNILISGINITKAKQALHIDTSDPSHIYDVNITGLNASSTKASISHAGTVNISNSNIQVTN